MLLEVGLTLTASKPEAPTKLVLEPELDTIKAPETKCADQSTSEPEQNLT